MPKNESKIWNDSSKKEKPTKVGFEFKDIISAEEYLEWKSVVPIEFRRLVESHLKNTELTPSQTSLPLTDQFLNEFASEIINKIVSKQVFTN